MAEYVDMQRNIAQRSNKSTGDDRHTDNMNPLIAT